MRVICGWLLSAVVCFSQTPSVRQIIDRLGAEADAFERSAYLVIGTETLHQTRPAGIQVSRRGVQTRVPERSRVIVSKYSYVPVDEKGGSLREARDVITVDGLEWNKRRALDTSDKGITVRTDAQRRRLLEAFESHGLAGIVTDASQAILLFGRGNTSKYKYSYEGTEKDDLGISLIVLHFEQIDGTQEFRIYENKDVVSDKIRGKLWIRAKDLLPIRVGMETVRQNKESRMRDTIVVQYAKSDFGLLLPTKVLHEQYQNGAVNVIDSFEYTDFRLVVQPSRSR